MMSYFNVMKCYDGTVIVLIIVCRQQQCVCRQRQCIYNQSVECMHTGTDVLFH